jgi:hypothetical protein
MIQNGDTARCGRVAVTTRKGRKPMFTFDSPPKRGLEILTWGDLDVH